MKIDSKKILTIGAGAVVGYLLFCKFMKRADAKSLEEGVMQEEAPTEEGGIGGGGGGGIFGGGGGSVPLPPVANIPVLTPIPTQGYVVVGQGGILSPLSGLNPNNPSQATVPISNVAPQRETPAPTPAPTSSSNIVANTSPIILQKPPVVSTNTSPILREKPPVVSTTPSKFTDFDGNPNFQDQLL